MEIHFNTWFTVHRIASEGLSEAESRKAHENRRPYDILIGNIKSPDCYISLNNDFILVGYLDDLKREKITAEYNEVSPGRIFLKELQIWEYEGDSNTKLVSIRYRFTEDGHYGVGKDDLKTREQTTIEPKERIDVTSHYKAYPDFGEYEFIAEPLDIYLQSLQKSKLYFKPYLKEPTMTLYYEAKKGRGL